MPRIPKNYFPLDEALARYEKVVKACLEGTHPAFNMYTESKQYRFRVLVNSHLRELWALTGEVVEPPNALDDCCPGTHWDEGLGMCVPDEDS
jgi:hypothetical protein